MNKENYYSHFKKKSSSAKQHVGLLLTLPRDPAYN